jgi:hypothetical protein
MWLGSPVTRRGQMAGEHDRSRTDPFAGQPPNTARDYSRAPGDLSTAAQADRVRPLDGSRRGTVSPSWRWRFLACLLWSRWVPLRSLNKPAPSGPSTPTAGNDQAGGLTTTRPCTRATSRSHKACSSPLRSSQSWCRGRSTFKVAWLNGGTGCSLRSASLRHSFDE